jgi:hypothetical protein
MKKKVIKYFGDGSVVHTAIALEMSPQRVRAWHDEMTITEKDGVIAKAVRKNASLPENMRVKLITTLIPAWLLK